MKRLAVSFSSPTRVLRDHISERFQGLKNSTGMRKKMTVLVDSWSWIEYFKSSSVGVKDIAPVIEGPQNEVIVSAVNIAEVYKAFLSDYPYPDNQRLAEDSRAVMVQRSYVLDVDQEMAVDTAKINHKLKLGLGDSIMYATALREGAKVLTGDPHFKGIKDAIYLGK